MMLYIRVIDVTSCFTIKYISTKPQAILIKSEEKLFQKFLLNID